MLRVDRGLNEAVTPWPVLRKWIAGGEELIISQRF